MMYIGIGIGLLLILVIFLRIKESFFTQPTSSMSFKASSELVGLPIITFYTTSNIKLHFLLDTGADRSIFDSKSLDLVEYKILKNKGVLTDASGTQREVAFAELNIMYDRKSYSGTFQLIDVSPISDAIGLTVKGKKIPILGVIGNDFLTKYKYILDFEKMIAYSKR